MTNAAPRCRTLIGFHEQAVSYIVNYMMSLVW